MARNEKEPAAPAEVGVEKSWNESQWFWWADPEQGISGFHRIAHQPNRKNAHIWNAIIDDTGRYTRRVSSQVTYSPEMRAGGIYSIEGLSFQHVEQGGLACKVDQDDVRLDLSFEDLHRAVSFDEIVSAQEAKDMMGEVGSGHTESAGRVSGTLKSGTRDIKVSGYGHRDHTWGARDVLSLQCTTWSNGTIGEEFSFFVTAGTVHGEPPRRLGYVAEHGSITPIREWRLYPWMDIDGVSMVRVSGYVETTGGKRFDLEFSGLMGSTIVTLDELFLCETAFVLTVGGKKKGVACMERSINPCGGQRLPSPAINAIYEDGVGQLGKIGE